MGIDGKFVTRSYRGNAIRQHSAAVIALQRGVGQRLVAAIGAGGLLLLLPFPLALGGLSHDRLDLLPVLFVDLKKNEEFRMRPFDM